MTSEIIIKPTVVFERPSRIVAGHIITGPDIFPRDTRVQVFLASGEVRNITLHSAITTSPEAIQNNLHGFVYSGDVLHESDLSDSTLISNLPYHEARRLYALHAKLN